MGDVVDSGGNIKRLENDLQKSFVTYIGLQKTIPKEWRSQVYDRENVQTLWTRIKNIPKVASFLHKKLNETEGILEKLKDTWDRKLGSSVNIEEL